MNKTMDGIYPLIAGITTDEQTSRILSHLESEDEMPLTVIGTATYGFRINGLFGKPC